MSSTYTSPVADDIKARLDEIKDEEDQLTQALTALRQTRQSTPASGSTRKSPGRPRKAAKKGPKASRASRDGKTWAEQIQEHLQENPGQTGTQIAKSLGMTNPHAYGTLKKMLDEGTAKKAEDKTYTAA